MISFALGELNITSFDYLYRMTWAEFTLRLYAFNRIEKRDMYKVREIAYYSMIGSHLDPKKLPKTKERFMPLDDKAGKPTKEQIDLIEKAKQKYWENAKTGS